jgi:hypothetical protein
VKATNETKCPRNPGDRRKKYGIAQQRWWEEGRRLDTGLFTFI